MYRVNNISTHKRNKNEEIEKVQKKTNEKK